MRSRVRRLEYLHPHRRWPVVVARRFVLVLLSFVLVSGASSLSDGPVGSDIFSEATARRAKPSNIVEIKGEVEVDWTRGLMISVAGASADLRAPTAAIARVKAERTAAELATAKLVVAAATLPGRGKTADGLAGQAKKRWAALGLEASVLKVEYSSDGSARVWVGLPIEAVRRAMVGPQKPPTQAAGEAPSRLVIDARSLKVSPAVGVRITAGAETLNAPLLFGRFAASGGKAMPARRASDGVIEVADEHAKALAAARNAGTAVFVLIK